MKSKTRVKENRERELLRGIGELTERGRERWGENRRRERKKREREREIAMRGRRVRDSYERLKICLHLQKLLECTVMKYELRGAIMRGKK